MQIPINSTMQFVIVGITLLAVAYIVMRWLMGKPLSVPSIRADIAFYLCFISVLVFTIAWQGAEIRTLRADIGMIRATLDGSMVMQMPERGKPFEPEKVKP